jgi:cell division protein FtsZ
MAATLLEARMEGARSILLNVSGSRKLKLAELDEVAKTVLATAGQDANVVFGMSLDSRLRDEVQVTLIATGFDAAPRADESATMSAGAEPEEWRPVWLRRSGADPVPKPTPATPGPRARRTKRTAAQTTRPTDAAP